MKFADAAGILWGRARTGVKITSRTFAVLQIRWAFIAGSPAMSSVISDLQLPVV